MTFRKTRETGVQEFRSVERAGTNTGGLQSAWKLAGVGSVGSQSLLGLPIVHRLLEAAGDRGRLWPFEPIDRGDAIVIAEIWPSLVAFDHIDHPIRDAQQVIALRDLLLDDAAFRATLDVGIQAGFQLTQAVWDGMVQRGGGALIFVSSQSGIKGFADETAYCAAKHALEGFSKCLALEGAPHGIVSCTITPGMAMHTPMSEKNYPPELKAKWVDPGQLAPAFVQIATADDLRFTGQRLNAWELSVAQTPGD